jgi:hypothetical protein
MPNAAQRDLIAGCAGLDTEPPQSPASLWCTGRAKIEWSDPRKTTINSRFSNVNCVTSHAQIMLRVAGLIIRQAKGTKPGAFAAQFVKTRVSADAFLDFDRGFPHRW